MTGWLFSLDAWKRKARTIENCATSCFEAEVALKDQRERVAAHRRQLPLNTDIQDYEFHEGPADLTKDGPFPTVRLSKSFDDPLKPLVVYLKYYGAPPFYKLKISRIRTDWRRDISTVQPPRSPTWHNCSNKSWVYAQGYGQGLRKFTDGDSEPIVAEAN